MAIGMILKIGYISGYTTDCDKAEAFDILQNLVRNLNMRFWDDGILRLNYNTIHMSDDEDYSLRDYCNQYRAKEGNPLSIHEEEQFIHVMCSGGGQSRKIKEIVAMMFCRIVMERMHAQGIPISITVT